MTQSSLKRRFCTIESRIQKYLLFGRTNNGAHCSRLMIGLLFDAGADIEIRDEYYNTPLIDACYIDNAALVKLPVSRKADVLARKYRQEIPLTVAKNKNTICR